MENKEKWRKLLAEYSNSGKTVKDFCAGKRIKVSSFYYNKKHQNKRQTASASDRSSKGFLKLEVSHSPGTLEKCIEISRGGTTLKVPADMEPDRIASLLRAVFP